MNIRPTTPVNRNSATRLKQVARDGAEMYHLPGRDWLLMIGPQNSTAENLTVGVATFPPGSAPPGHTHATQEEVVYILSGSGELITPEGSVALEAGTAVYIPVGLHHATVASNGGLQLVSVFSPPVIPGSYETETA